jgi:aspartyl-tRNA(Asn)/glutamyl-tRNA(Gln) amidotransferase subunit A
MLELSLAQIAAAIRARQVSCLEVTLAAIEQAETAQPVTNAFVEILADRALDQARALDAELRAGRLRGPLHGVPLAHKDCFERAGAAMGVGSKLLAGSAPGTQDATALARLEAAGAVDLGRLNLNEFVAGPTGQNPHLGDCTNAWDPDRISGGSSSGSGSAVASGAVYGALGSDTGGSIRLPTAMQGLFGLKPTYGRVSRAGCFPRAHSLDCVGPMTRTAEDAALMLGALAGPDPRDPTALDAPVPDYAARIATASAGSRLVTLADPGPMDPDIAARIEDLLRVAAELHGPVARRPFPQFAACDALGDVLSKVEASTLHGHWMATQGGDYSTAVHSRTEPGLHIPAQRYLESLALRARMLEDFLATVMADADALICPAIPIPVPTRIEADMEGAGRVFPVVAALTSWTRPFSYLGLPVLTVPIGLDRNGMPVAAQLVGRPFGEARLLSLGAGLSAALGWSFTPGLPARIDGDAA